MAKSDFVLRPAPRLQQADQILRLAVRLSLGQKLLRRASLTFPRWHSRAFSPSLALAKTVTSSRLKTHTPSSASSTNFLQRWSQYFNKSRRSLSSGPSIADSISRRRTIGGCSDKRINVSIYTGSQALCSTHFCPASSRTRARPAQKPPGVPENFLLPHRSNHPLPCS